MAVPDMTNNTPSAGHISWDLFHIQYEGVGYEVPAGSTSDRWVWWRFNAGVPTIESGSSVPEDLTADDLLLFANKNGIAVRIQSSNLIDGELIVDGSILADAIAVNQITSNHIVTVGLDAGVIKFGVMSGDRIAVNTLDGDRILAKSITAGKMIISDFTNLVADGDMTDVNSKNWYYVAPDNVTRVKIADEPAYLKNTNTLLADRIFFRNEFIFAGAFGDEFAVVLEVSTPATNTQDLSFINALYATDQNGGTLLWKPCVEGAMPIAPNTPWTQIEANFKITDSRVAKLQWNSYVTGITAPAGTQELRIRRISLRRKNSGKLIVDGTIVTEKLAAGAITAEKISAEAITAEKITSTLNWTAEQYVGMIHIHPTEGITIPQIGTDDSTHFAADGSGNKFAGGVVVNDGFDSYGGINMYGTDNFLSGELKAGTGVNDPVSAPLITASYDTADMGGVGFARKGMCPSISTPNAVMVVDSAAGESSVAEFYGSSGLGTGLSFKTYAGMQAFGGITRIGNYYYALMRLNSSTGNGSWYIHVYSSTGTFVVSYACAISPTSYPAIGTDGTLIYVAWPDGTNLQARRYNAYGMASAGLQTGNTINMGVWSGTVPVQAINVVAGIWYAVWTGAVYAHTVAGGATSAVRTSAAAYPKPTGSNWAGAFHDGTVWWSLNGGRYITKHTNLSGTWDFAYDYTDADTGGSGVAHTRPSAIKTIAPTMYSKWTVTIPNLPPDDLTNDGANTCRIFAAPSGSPLVFQNQLVTDGDGVTGKPLSTSKTFDTLSLSGVTPNVVNDFSSRLGAIGRFSSAQTSDGGNPIWHADGDGSGKMGPVQWGVNGLSSSQPVKYIGGSHTTPTGAAAFRFPTGLAEGIFVAPASGNVMIFTSAYLKSSADNNPLLIGAEVRTGSVIRSGTIVSAADTNDAIGNYNLYYVRAKSTLVLTGLTPGATYNMYTAVYSSTAGCLVTASTIQMVPIL